MPVSSTAQRIPVASRIEQPAAASAFTVSRDRQTLALARRFRLTLHINPDPSATVGKPSKTAANAWISSGVSDGLTPTSPVARPARSSSMTPTMRMSFCSSRGSVPDHARAGHERRQIAGELLQRGPGPRRTERGSPCAPTTR